MSFRNEVGNVKAGYQPPKLTFETSTTLWRMDEMIRRREKYWRELTGEDGRTGSREGSMREEESVYSGTYSVFPVSLAEYAYMRYAGEAPAKILDPFAGGPPRALAAALMGHTYHGCDIRQEAIDENEEVMERCGIENVHYHNIDSRKLEKTLKRKGPFDMMFTCPPYYNLEVYSDLPDDISTRKTYADFIDDIYDVIAASKTVLRKGAFAVWVVNNFRQGDKLIDFRGDTVACFSEIGFTYWQEVILTRSAGSASVRAGRSWNGFKLVPQHEYMLVFRVPEK